MSFLFHYLHKIEIRQWVLVQIEIHDLNLYGLLYFLLIDSKPRQGKGGIGCRGVGQKERNNKITKQQTYGKLTLRISPRSVLAWCSYRCWLFFFFGSPRLDKLLLSLVRQTASNPVYYTYSPRYSGVNTRRDLPRFCMKAKRSSRNSFLWGSSLSSYSCNTRVDTICSWKQSCAAETLITVSLSVCQSTRQST